MSKRATVGSPSKTHGFIGWDFTSVPRGAYEKKGLNDSGVETFKDDSLKSMAREICQNSLDARLVSGECDAPVIVEFHRYESPSCDFPDANSLVDAFKRAQSFWEKEEVDETVRFFKNAEMAMNANSISWMRISDFHTFGLRGVERATDAQGTTPWSSLVMSSGVSNKPGDAGGLFGIGKYATFSCSAIRTCFYSTITDSNSRGSQGVSRLVSFLKDDEITLGTGYYRRNYKEPIGDILKLDPSFERDKVGTDIFVPCFLPTDSWMDDVQRAVLEGFLYAIFHKTLEVKLVDGKSKPITLNRKWLDDCFNSGTLPDETVQQNYKALILDTEENIFRKDFGEDGQIELKLLLEPNLNRRIAMIRETGMKIFDKGNFSSTISFSGVLIVNGEGLNKRTKAFENPQHNKWEVNRSKNDKVLYKEIIDFCRESLKELVEGNHTEESGANLGDILPASGLTDDRETKETLTPKISMRQILRKPVKCPRSDEDDDDDDDDDDDNDEGQPGGRMLRPIEPGSSRFICTDEQSGTYHLILIPKKGEDNAAIGIKAVAELNTYPADIVWAKLSNGIPLEVVRNRIHGVRLQKGKRLEIIIKMNYSEYVSLEVKWYGII